MLWEMGVPGAELQRYLSSRWCSHLAAAPQPRWSHWVEDPPRKWPQSCAWLHCEGQAVRWAGTPWRVSRWRQLRGNPQTCTERKVIRVPLSTEIQTKRNSIPTQFPGSQCWEKLEDHPVKGHMKLREVTQLIRGRTAKSNWFHPEYLVDPVYPKIPYFATIHSPTSICISTIHTCGS